MSGKEAVDAPPKYTFVQNIAGVLPTAMMGFVLSAMLVFDAVENDYIGGAAYLRWMNAHAEFVRLAFPALLVVLFAFSALAIVKNWRAFAIFPEFLEARIGREHFFWPFGLLYITYFGTVLAYAHFVWLHQSCSPTDSMAILRDGAVCSLDASRYYAALEFSGDQFLRGVWGDFWELVGPADPAHSVAKDAVFVVVTGFYRLLAQTALFVLPASVLTGAGILFRRPR